MDERNVSKPAMRGHKLVLNNRTASLVTGVKDVLSFDLNEVLLETEQGMLMVKGTDLHVNRLSLEKGEIDIEGRTDSLVYSAGGGAKSGESFLQNYLSSGKCSDERVHEEKSR